MFFDRIALNAVTSVLQDAWRAAAKKVLEEGQLYSGSNFDPPEFLRLTSWQGFLPPALIGQLPVALRQFTGPSIVCRVCI